MLLRYLTVSIIMSKIVRNNLLRFSGYGRNIKAFGLWKGNKIQISLISGIFSGVDAIGTVDELLGEVVISE